MTDLALRRHSPDHHSRDSGQVVRAAHHPRWSIIPFILVSGSLDEQLAIDSFRCGATDCVPKRDLSRLLSAVRRAMRKVEDRAERQQLEAQIIEAQKMEVISQLSSGVAHDFNNILGVFFGYSDLIALDLWIIKSLDLL